MRRYLFLIPLLFIVFSGVAEAQSFCSLTGVAWTRCYDFTTSDHGFTPHISNGTRGSWPGGQHVPGTGFVALPYPAHPNNGSGWRKWVRIQTPSDWPSTSITQVKLIYQLTPGISDDTTAWAGTNGQSGFIQWDRDDVVSGAGTLSGSAAITHSGSVGWFWAQASRCTSCTSGTIDGSMTLIAIVLGGDGDPLPGGVDPSSGDGGGATITVPTDAFFTSTNSWISQFAPILAIGVGIMIALAILRMIGKYIVDAF